MKSVLFLIPDLGGGGAERVLVNLVNNLDKNRFDITVQTIFDEGVNRRFLDNAIKYIPGIKKKISGNVLFFKLFSPKTLYNMFIKKHYDIIISYLEGVSARIVSGCTDEQTKIVSWIHVEQNNKKTASYSFRSYNEANQCYNKFDRIICVADSVKSDFIKIFPNISYCQVLYNTIDNNKIISQGKKSIDLIFDNNTLNIVSTGRLVAEKGYDRLLNVHKRLIGENICHKIYILGEGRERNNLEKMITDMNLTDSFFLLGFCDNPYKYISKCDLFVCSSRREGFSSAVAEALILGKPVVSTNCSGACELLGKNNEYGVVTDNSEDGIYFGLKKLLTCNELLVHYKKQACIRGRSFSIEKTVSAVEDMLSEL